MFVDWVTVSFGKIENEIARQSVFDVLRVFSRRHKDCFTMNTFGAISFCFPGKFWQKVEEQDGLATVDDVMRCCSTAKISRVDFAHDFADTPDITGDIWRRLATFENKTTITSPSGDTLYVGSRESDRYLRFYNKAKEIENRTGVKLGLPCWRLELETKGDVAREYLSHYRRSPDIVQSDIAKRYGIEDWLQGVGNLIKVHVVPENDPFKFVRQFHTVITRARQLDPDKFDAIIPKVKGKG